MSERAHVPGAVFGEDFWDERYRSAHRVWSGNPNPQLVAEVAGRPPAHALDVGCGEGADAIWLARAGWTVVGAGISGAALEPGRGRGPLRRETRSRSTTRSWWPPGRRPDGQLAVA